MLELATDAELFELEDILFGPSYFSPLLKSIANKRDVDYVMVKEDIEGRDDFIAHLESRFLFLAADAGSTLRGWRPSYRNVLLAVRRKLGIPCSSKLSTEDLEGEIFLQLLHEYSSSDQWDDIKYSSSNVSFEVGLDWWKVHGLVALRVGAKEVQQMILKGGGMLALSNLGRLLARKLSKKMLLEAADYKIKHEILVRGGQLAAVNLESRAALFAARQGLAHAVSRSLGVRSMMMLLGPILWGTFLADLVIQSLGTDYARILRAIYAFAQIRLYRTHGLASNAVR